jgi:hypothetical protein
MGRAEPVEETLVVGIALFYPGRGHDLAALGRKSGGGDLVDIVRVVGSCFHHKFPEVKGGKIDNKLPVGPDQPQGIRVIHQLEHKLGFEARAKEHPPGVELGVR